MAKFKDTLIGKAFKGLGKWIKSLGISSWWRSATGQGLSNAQQEANAFSANEAEKARQFEQQMSDTSYQRQVADMKLAGVNPALMYGNGASGASTPSSPAPGSVDPGSPGLSPIGLLQQIQQLSLLKSQKRNIEADTSLKTQKAKESQSLIRQIEVGIDKTLSEIDSLRTSVEGQKLDNESKSIILKYLDDNQRVALNNSRLTGESLLQEMTESNARISKLSKDEQKILQDISESRQRISNLIKEGNLTDEQVNKVKSEIKMVDEQTNNLVKNGKLTQLDIDHYMWNHTIKMPVASAIISPTGDVYGVPLTGKRKKNLDE